MQISFPAQSVAPMEPVSVLAEKTATNAAASSTITRQEVAAQYFNPKITVDASSGIVLLQYRAQNSDGTVRLQIPSETVVDHYKTYGYNRSDVPETPVQVKSSDTATSCDPSVEPLSETIISPETPARAKPFVAGAITRGSVLTSFKQGITIETSGLDIRDTHW